MAKMLDFTKAKKPTLPIKFDDGSMIYVFTPGKAEFEEMTDAQSYFDTALDGDIEALNRLYGITARLMSNNKTGRKIKVEEISESFDVGDVILFFRGYTEFISEVIAEKN